MPITRFNFRLLAMLALAGPCANIHPEAALAGSSSDSTMFILDSVTFDGNQRVSTDTLNGVAGLTKGQKVNRDSIVQAFQNVQDEYKKDNVGGTIQPTMKTRGTHMSVVFQISEEAAPAAPIVVQPLLDHETFTGNVKVSSERLTPALTIKPGTSVTKEMVIADMTALSDAYKAAKQGAMITPKVTNLPEGRIDLNFEINENPPQK